MPPIYCRPMSIKSDRWIRRMVTERRMIEPFAENQARCGIITNVTPFEPEWEGFVTLEISNTTPLPARIYANEGIAQVLFFTADEGDECEISYKDKKGKYQAQTGITLPKL